MGNSHDERVQFPGWMAWLFFVGNILMLGGLLAVLVAFVLSGDFAFASNFFLVSALGGMMAHHALEAAEAFAASARPSRQLPGQR